MPVYLGAHNITSPLAFTSHENFERVSRGESAIKQRPFPFTSQDIFCSYFNDQQLAERFSVLADPASYTKLERMCLLSIHDVIQQSGLDLTQPDTLIILSTTKGNIDLLDAATAQQDPKRVYLSELAAVITRHFGCANKTVVLSNACISGLLAMLVAKRYIESGQYKHILVCGADLVSEFTLSGFKSFNALSASRCKPFDAHRDGINLGEAAASILLSAEKTGNLVISSGASANDANHISGPSRTGEGLFQALNHCLENTDKTSIGFISAHGTATEYNDEMEAMAFQRAGLNDRPLHSLKAYYGHTLGAAGVLESILAVMALQENKLIASLGFEENGTTHTMNLIRQTTVTPLQRCLKTASGFGGCNAVAIFEKIA